MGILDKNFKVKNSITIQGGKDQANDTGETSNNPIITGLQTWNAGGVTFDAQLTNVTDTASASTSTLDKRQVGGTDKWVVDKTGLLTIGNVDRLHANQNTGTADAPNAKGTLTGIFHDQKTAVISGLNVAQYEGTGYTGLVSITTYKPASTANAGEVSQMAFTTTGNIWFRSNTDSTTWGAWQKWMVGPLTSRFDAGFSVSAYGVGKFGDANTEYVIMGQANGASNAYIDTGATGAGSSNSLEIKAKGTLHLTLDGTNTTIGKRLVLPAATSSQSSLNIPSYTGNPSTLADGDIWNNAGDLYYYYGTNSKRIAFLTPTGGAVYPQLNISGGVSGDAWGIDGIGFYVTPSTYTDSNAGTTNHMAIHTVGVPTLARSNGTATYTNASTLYIAGAPIAGTNVTAITNPYSLYVNSGDVWIGGSLYVQGTSTTINSNSISYTNADITSIQKTLTASATAQTLDTFNSTLYRSVKYLIQLKQDTSYEMCELMVVHDGTTVTVMSYGHVSTSSKLISSFEGSISTGTATITITLVNGAGASQVVNMVRTAIDV